MLENKWLLAFLALILGVFLGGSTVRGVYQTDGPDKETLNNQITNLRNQIQTLQEKNTKLEAKFQRSTILYDGVVFKTKRWLIPAEIEPIAMDTGLNDEFTYYDPKTQMESVHMQPKVH
jgi:hypothetical protein